jgi:hypothetical protein
MARYLLYRRMGVPQGWSERVRKTSSTPGFDPQTVQSVASRYIGPYGMIKLKWLLRKHDMKVGTD